MIILIDDDHISNFICTNLMQSIAKGVRIETFLNPEEALDFILRNREQIQLLLLDLNMPVLDGWALLQSLDNIGVNIPVIILTSSVSTLDDQNAKKHLLSSDKN